MSTDILNEQQEINPSEKRYTPKPFTRRSIKKQLNEARKLTISDPLTGLHNEVWAKDDLERRIAEANRTHEPLYVLYADFDDFKAFNTAFGHSGGDEVLKLINLIPTRPDEPISRLHGDEFMQVFSHANISEILEALRRYKKNVLDNSTSLLKGLRVISDEITPEDVKKQATLSFGLALYEGETSNELIIKANEALLYAKRHGKNTMYIAQKNADGNSLVFNEVKE